MWASPIKSLLIFCLGIAIAMPSTAKTYLETKALLSFAFGTEHVEQKVVWITPSIRKRLYETSGGTLKRARLKYWQSGQKQVWVLEMIGKERPITFGYIIDNNRINNAHVLEYREDRGWEIHRTSFTKQYIGATLTQQKLSNNIDGISGATLSVRAMNTTAKMALLLSELSQNE